MRSNSFIIFFTFEIVLKIVALQKYFWIDVWNLADLFIIVVAYLEYSLSSLEGSNLSVLRLCRLVRVTRLVRRFERLHHLVLAFLHAMQSVAMVGGLLSCILFIFSVIARSTFGEDSGLRNNGDVDGDAWFGSLPRCFVTLLQIMTFDSWVSQISRPVGQIRPAAWFFFTPFLMVVSLGMLNLLTAVFIDSLLEENKKRDKKNNEKLKERRTEMIAILEGMFYTFDKDNNGELDNEEVAKLTKFLEHDDSRRLFETAGLDMDNIQMAITLADVDENKNVSYQEFLDALRSLNEATQKRDIWVLQRHMRHVREVTDGYGSRLASLEKKLERTQKEQEVNAVSQGALLEGIMARLDLALEQGIKPVAQRGILESKAQGSNDGRSQPGADDAAKLKVGKRDGIEGQVVPHVLPPLPMLGNRVVERQAALPEGDTGSRGAGVLGEQRPEGGLPQADSLYTTTDSLYSDSSAAPPSAALVMQPSPASTVEGAPDGREASHFQNPPLNAPSAQLANQTAPEAVESSGA